jgi:phage tail P2-like protein
MIDLRDASLLDFLPDSIASDPEIVALSLAIDPELRDVGAAIIEAIILPRLGEQREEILNELAWACNLNSLLLWDTATVDGKRALLRNIFKVRKKSGTPFAVRRVFDLVSVTALVIEWWQDLINSIPADPYTYRLRIIITSSGITLLQLQSLDELTYRFAPTRSALSEFAVEADRSASTFGYPVITSGHHTVIEYGGP